MLIMKFAVLLALETVAVSGDVSCAPIQLCPDATISSVSSSTSIPVYTSVDVSAKGHISGVKPLTYDLHLFFVNETHFKGTVNITMNIRQDTNLVIVGVGDNLQYDRERIAIYDNSLRPTGSNNCIDELTYVKTLSVLVLKLRKKLPKNTQHVLSFLEFNSLVYDEKTQQGAKGLRKLEQKSTVVLYTQMRTGHSRTVFPCFDHPSLKASFRFCSGHRKNWLIASVTRMSSSFRSVSASDGSVLDCFQETPPIATYVFGIVAMRGYTWKIVGNRPRIRLLFPRQELTKCANATDVVTKALTGMKTMTNARFAFGQLDMVLLYPAGDRRNVPFDNAGLVLVDCGSLENELQQDGGFHRLFHAVVRQWLGAVVTIDHWGETCLQDSLAEYCVWLLQHSFRNRSLYARVDQLGAAMSTSPYRPMVIADEDQVDTDHNRANCYIRGPLIFHILYRTYSLSVINRFSRRLLAIGKFKNTGLSVWNEILASVLPKYATNMDNYLKRWFGESGPLTLFVRFNGNDVTVEQTTPDSPEQSDGPVLLSFISSISLDSMFFAFNAHYFNFTKGDDVSWVLFDPCDETPAIKVYDTTNYMSVFDALLKRNLILPIHTSRRGLLRGFCKALITNQLPQPGDNDKDSWKRLFQLAYNLSAPCSCCLTPSWNSRRCSHDLRQHCDKIKLVKILGYGRTLS